MNNALHPRIANAPVVSPAGAVAIDATPYKRCDPATIPSRPWVYGRQLLRGTVSLVIAPGGAGKSGLMTGTALALATGRDFLGHLVWGGAKRVWLWNLEDSRDELQRSIEAAALHWEIPPDDPLDGLFLDSAMDGRELKLAEAHPKGGFVIIRPVADGLIAALKNRAVDVLIVDPFVSSHGVPENDNGAIDAVSKQWARIAAETRCAIVLVHHVRKTGGMDVDAESARGASSLVAASRFTLALNNMSKDEADRLGIEERDRAQYVRADAAKSNRAPAGKANWFRKVSVSLGNGRGLGPADDVMVVAPWTPPDAFDGITERDIAEVQARIADGEWRENSQATDWAGYAVADVLKLDASRKAAKARIRSILREWINNGVLIVETRLDGNRKERPFIAVGKPVSP